MMKKYLIALVVFLTACVALYFFESTTNDPTTPTPIATSTTALSQDGAIEAVIATYPELALYKTTSLPPSSILAKEGENGWNVGFIQSGSGVAGILSAKCYHVTNEKSVTLVGTYERGDKVAEDVMLDTCGPVFPDEVETPPTSTMLPYGDVTLKLNQIAVFKDVTLRPLTIEEDSRCPSDVQCIWAGRVRVKVEVISGGNKHVSILTQGEVLTIEKRAITLTSVLPAKSTKVTIANADYQLVFNVMPQGSNANTKPQAKCFVGGCSGQLCTDREDIMSTCEYREEYACYRSATCERQLSGECGWTKTQELTACLNDSNKPS